MNKNIQYTLMSLAGILLMIIASGAFDSDPYYDEGYYDDTESSEQYDIEEPVAMTDDVDAVENEVVTTVEDEVVAVVEGEVTYEQYVEWVDQLALVDMQYPNDMQRVESYQSLLDDNGNAYAPIFLASHLINSENESKSVDRYEALLASFGFDVGLIDSLKVLSDNQNVNAMFVLGIYYYHMQDYEQSRSWLEQASNQGHAGAMNQLAWIYRKGLGVSKDIEYAAAWHLSSAESNYPRAMTNLAYLYDIGGGVEKDLEASAMWYKRAAELNSAAGLYVLAGYTLHGTGGVEKNEPEGVRLLMESAQLGNKRSMYAIGKRYENGDGLTQDMGQAIDWYRQSAKLGESDAVAAMDRLYY